MYALPAQSLAREEIVAVRVGVGNMGNPMAENVLEQGYPMTVFDASWAAVRNLVAAGARAAASVREVTESAEVVLTSLPGSPEVTFHTIAKELHVPVTFASIAQHYEQAALAAGLGEKDTSVVYTIIERLAGLEKG